MKGLTESSKETCGSAGDLYPCGQCDSIGYRVRVGTVQRSAKTCVVKFQQRRRSPPAALSFRNLPPGIRALVTMAELAQFKKVHKVVLPSFDTEVYKHVDVTEGEEVMTRRPEEEGTQALFVNTSVDGDAREA